MNGLGFTRTRRVETETDRQDALTVLRCTYQDEKGWVLDVEPMFPADDLRRADVSWFLAMKSGMPVGVLRVLYDPPLEQYVKYGLHPISPDIDFAHLISSERIAEVGRFAVLPERRTGIGVVISLMRAATRELVARNCSRLVTDVFENEANSPLGFHTRVIGFKPIATHEIGELRHVGRRVTLLLDLKSAYRTLRARGNRVFRVLTRGWSHAMHQSLAL